MEWDPYPKTVTPELPKEIQFPLSTGQVCNLLRTPEHRVLNSIRLGKIKDVLNVHGRRVWSAENVMCLARLLGKASPELRNLCRQINREVKTRVKNERDTAQRMVVRTALRALRQRAAQNHVTPDHSTLIALGILELAQSLRLTSGTRRLDGPKLYAWFAEAQPALVTAENPTE